MGHHLQLDRSLLFTGLLVAPDRLSQTHWNTPVNNWTPWWPKADTGQPRCMETWPTHLRGPGLRADLVVRARVPALPPLYISLPLIVCAFISSLYSLRGVCVRSGVIQTLQQIYCFDERHHFTEKRKKQHKLLSGVVWSLRRARYTKRMAVTLHTTIPYRGCFQQQNQKGTYRLK